MANERKLEVTALSADGLATAYTKLGAASEERGATLEAAQYARRTMDCGAWITSQAFSVRDRVVARAAFVAGWEARKKAEYDMVLGLDKSKAE